MKKSQPVVTEGSPVRKYFENPAIKHLNVKAGEVIKIERESKTAGKSVYYREVIEG